MITPCLRCPGSGSALTGPALGARSAPAARERGDLVPAERLDFTFVAAPCPQPDWEHANLPVSARLGVSKDVRVTVVGVDFEPPPDRREPAIDHTMHGEAALSEPESKRIPVRRDD